MYLVQEMQEEEPVAVEPVGPRSMTAMIFNFLIRAFQPLYP